MNIHGIVLQVILLENTHIQLDIAYLTNTSIVYSHSCFFLAVSGFSALLKSGYSSSLFMSLICEKFTP